MADKGKKEESNESYSEKISKEIPDGDQVGYGTKDAESRTEILNTEVTVSPALLTVLHMESPTGSGWSAEQINIERVDRTELKVIGSVMNGTGDVGLFLYFQYDRQNDTLNRTALLKASECSNWSDLMDELDLADVSEALLNYISDKQTELNVAAPFVERQRPTTPPESA